MTIQLPEGISPEDEIALTWHHDQEGMTKVVASLAGAKITVETDEESAVLVPWLVAATPTILEAAWAQIEAQEDDEESQEAPQ